MSGTTQHGCLRLVEEILERAEDDGSDMASYRKHTVALLRRYFRVALDLGRVPSVLGGQMFRARVTSYRTHTFEDVVIFVYDMERCLEKLDKTLLEVLAAMVLVEYSLEDTAKVLGITERHAKRLYPLALDRLSRILLRKQLLKVLPGIPTGEDEEEEEDLPPKKPVCLVRLGTLEEVDAARGSC